MIVKRSATLLFFVELYKIRLKGGTKNEWWT